MIIFINPSLTCSRQTDRQLAYKIKWILIWAPYLFLTLHRPAYMHFLAVDFTSRESDAESEVYPRKYKFHLADESSKKPVSVRKHA